MVIICRLLIKYRVCFGVIWYVDFHFHRHLQFIWRTFGHVSVVTSCSWSPHLFKGNATFRAPAAKTLPMHVSQCQRVCVCVSYMFSLSGLQGLGRVVVELGSTQSDPVFGPRCHLEAQVKMRSHTWLHPGSW